MTHPKRSLSGSGVGETVADHRRAAVATAGSRLRVRHRTRECHAGFGRHTVRHGTANLTSGKVSGESDIPGLRIA
jgi:hypothetical protein